MVLFPYEIILNQSNMKNIDKNLILFNYSLKPQKII
jgi:hypothetical protein